MSTDSGLIESLPEPTPRPKRLVIRHASGLHQILGVWDRPAPSYLDASSGVQISGKPVALSLVKATPTHYLYVVAVT